ncbi:hypothetical protein D3C75_1365380 [compost metagenome]
MYNRLTEVKKQHGNAELHRRDVDWLIEQAEKYKIVEDAYRNGSLDDLDEAFNKTMSDQSIKG